MFLQSQKMYEKYAKKSIIKHTLQSQLIYQSASCRNVPSAVKLGTPSNIQTWQPTREKLEPKYYETQTKCIISPQVIQICFLKNELKELNERTAVEAKRQHNIRLKV
ncbi:hypothetical protein Tsp_06392 [Trichinella spiralis]|uniref:hypothetical protein n=1 Tax=Trichinella spiralis TaxID=6334 RepID=UPI0001EFC2B0|nr:hypothetical protein Tsp_06392 [Trichinella spiralis]